MFSKKRKIKDFQTKNKKNFDKRNASITLDKMIVNLDTRYFMNRKDEKNESAGAKSIR